MPCLPSSREDLAVQLRESGILAVQSNEEEYYVPVSFLDTTVPKMKTNVLFPDVFYQFLQHRKQSKKEAT